MAKRVPEQKEYQVQAKIVSIVAVAIRAKSFEEATTHAATMTEDDFVVIQGENIDGSFRVSGVYESGLD